MRALLLEAAEALVSFKVRLVANNQLAYLELNQVAKTTYLVNKLSRSLADFLARQHRLLNSLACSVPLKAHSEPLKVLSEQIRVQVASSISLRLIRYFPSLALVPLAKPNSLPSLASLNNKLVHLASQEPWVNLVPWAS